MRKLSRIALVIALIVSILAMSVSAGTAIYTNGAANANSDSEDVISASYGGADYEGFLVYEMAPKALGDATFDLSNADYVYVRFYVENAANYDFGHGASLEISSAGKCDVEETNWSLDNFEFVDGWNEIAFDLYDTSASDADLTKINYVRFFWYTVGANTNIVDYVAFGAENEDFSSIKTELGGEIVKEETGPEDNYTRFTYDAADENTPAPADGLANVSGKFDLTPINVSNYSYAFVRVYIDGMDNYSDNGQLEICSKQNDVEELTYDANNLGLVNGWNELKLDLGAADGDSGFNPENCKFFRLYMFNEGGITINFDYIGFGNESDTFSENLPIYLLKPASQEAPAADAGTDAPATDTGTDAPTTTPSTPAAQTADYGIVAALVLLATSCAAIVVNKKNR